jgi:chromosome segregation ATPase
VEKANNLLSQRVIFWSVLGPFILLTTLAISMIKATQTVPTITLAALVGIPMCYRWKSRGLIASMALLAVLLLLTFTSLPPHQKFWQMGFSMAMALSFLVTSLSFEEVEEILINIQMESKSRLDNLWRLDEKLKKIQERWQTDREDYSVRLKLMGEEAEEQKALLTKYEKTLELSREELEKEKVQQQKLLHDLLSEKRRIDLLEREKKNLSDESAELKTTYSTKENVISQEQHDQFNRLNREVAELKERIRFQTEQQTEVEATLEGQKAFIYEQSLTIEQHKSTIEEQQTAINEYKTTIDDQQMKIHSFAELETIYADFQELDTLKATHGRALEALSNLEERYDKVQREKEHLIASIELIQVQAELEAKLHTEALLKVEPQSKQSLSTESVCNESAAEIERKLQETTTLYEEQNRELRRQMGLHKQLEDQFQQKSEVLNQTRAQLFQAEGQILDLLNSIEEIKKSDLDTQHKELEKMVVSLEQERKDHEKEITDLNHLVTMLFEEISQAAKEKTTVKV